jgi:small subunit ribosomal protein S20
LKFAEGKPMPHTTSAKKRLRQSAKQRARNRAAKKGIKLQIRAVLQAAKENAAGEALREEFRKAAKKLDKAAAKRVIHPNLAARKKSQLARLLNTKNGVAAPAAAK